MYSPQTRPRRKHLPPDSWLDAEAAATIPQFRDPPPRFAGLRTTEPANRPNPLSAFGEREPPPPLIISQPESAPESSPLPPPSEDSVLSSRLSQARHRIATGQAARGSSRSITPHRSVRPIDLGSPTPGTSVTGDGKRRREGEGRKKFTAKRRKICDDASPKGVEKRDVQVSTEKARDVGKEVKVDQSKPKDAPKSQGPPQIPDSREALSIGPSSVSRSKGKQPQPLNMQQLTPPRPIAKIPSHHEIIEIPDSSPSPSSSQSSPQSPTNSASISPTNLPSAETILALIDSRNADDAVVRELAGIYRRQRAAEEAVEGGVDEQTQGGAENAQRATEQEAGAGPVIVESAVTSQDPIGVVAGIGGGAVDAQIEADGRSEMRIEVPEAIVVSQDPAVNLQPPPAPSPPTTTTTTTAVSLTIVAQTETQVLTVFSPDSRQPTSSLTTAPSEWPSQGGSPVVDALMDTGEEIQEGEEREEGVTVQGSRGDDVIMEDISEQPAQPQEEQQQVEDPQDPISESEDDSDPFGDLGDDVWDVLMPIPSAAAAVSETAPALETVIPEVETLIPEVAPQASVEATTQATTQPSTDQLPSIPKNTAPTEPTQLVTEENTAQNAVETVAQTSATVADPGVTTDRLSEHVDHSEDKLEDLVPSPQRSIAEAVAQSNEARRLTGPSEYTVRKRRYPQVPRRTLGTPKGVEKHFEQNRQRAMALTPPPDFAPSRVKTSKDVEDKPTKAGPQPSEAVPETESHPAPSPQHGVDEETAQSDADSPVFKMRRPAQIIREDSDDESLVDMFGDSEEEVEEVEGLRLDVNTSVDLDAPPPNAEAGPSTGPDTQGIRRQKRTAISSSEEEDNIPPRKSPMTAKFLSAGRRLPSLKRPTTARELLGQSNIDSDSGCDSDVDYDLPAYEARPSGPSDHPSQGRSEKDESQHSPGESSSQPRRSQRIRRPPAELMSALQLAEAHLRQNQSPQDRPSEKSPRKPRGKGRRGGKGRKRKQAYAEETEDEEEVESESDEELRMAKQLSLADAGRISAIEAEQLALAKAASLHDIGILREEQEGEMAIAASQRIS